MIILQNKKYKQIVLIGNNDIKTAKDIEWNIESKERWGKETGRICERVGN